MFVKRLLRVRFQSGRDEAIWLTVYADLITNLMLIFLALFGLTMMGDQALDDALKSLQMTKLSQEDREVLMTQMDELEDDLRAQFGEEEELTLSRETDAIRIQFGENLLFDSGQAGPKQMGIDVLSRLGKTLENLPYTIVVEGHTDPVPLIPGSQYKNNWELSLARAMAVVKTLSEEGGVVEKNLAAAAYGPYKPRATNETSSGRKVNRRVEIAILEGFRAETLSPAQEDPNG